MDSGQKRENRLWSGLGPVAISEAEIAAARWTLETRPGRRDLSGTACLASDGSLPVPEVVAWAEERILVTQTSKSAPWAGNDPAFHGALIRLTLGEAVPLERLAARSATDGQGAMRLALDLLQIAHRDTTLWLPDRDATGTAALAHAAGIWTRRYRMFGTAAPDLSDALCTEGMLDDLQVCAPGDVVLLQASGQNPTGLDLPAASWTALASLCQQTGAVPLVMVAAPGLARGTRADMDGLRRLLCALPEALLVVDCAPSFALGRDGAGLVIAQTATPRAACRARGHLERLRVAHVETLPDHGARIVAHILHGPDLRPAWKTHLRHCRQRLQTTRQWLAGRLQEVTQEDCWQHIANGQGLFSRLPLRRDQTAMLRDAHGFHICANGRINLSGLDHAAVDGLAAAVADVRRETAATTLSSTKAFRRR